MPHNRHPAARSRRCISHSPGHSHSRRREALAYAEAEYFRKTFHFGLGGDLATGAAELVVGGVWMLLGTVCVLGTHLIKGQLAKARRSTMNRRMTAAALPSPEALEARWHHTQRKSLKEALHLGAMLMQIADTTSNAIRLDKNGKMAGRGGGLKGWLKTYCPSIPYSTAMRYKRLAEQLLQLLSIEGVGAGAAMDWVVPEEGKAQIQPWKPGAEAMEIAKVRACVGKLLWFHPSQRSLGKVLRRALEKAGKLS